MLSLNDRGKNHTARALLEKVTPELLSYKAWHSLESNFELRNVEYKNKTNPVAFFNGSNMLKNTRHLFQNKCLVF